MRLLSLLLSMQVLFASEEVISLLSQEDSTVVITCQSGRTLRLANEPEISDLISQMQEGERLIVEGERVVTVSHKSSPLILFADEGEVVVRDPIDTIQLFSLPRSGGRFLLSLLRNNFPAVAIEMRDRLSQEMITEMIGSANSLGEVRKRLRLGNDLGKCFSKQTLVVIGVREPKDWLKSLYSITALPFKEDPNRGFALFLLGKGRLPGRIAIKNPLTGERLANPIEVRRWGLLQALFVERTAHQSVVIDFEVAGKKPAAVIAKICADFGLAKPLYFKAAKLDASGRGLYRATRPIALTHEQEKELDLQLDKELEQHFKS